jgi:ABC-2 type transport system ATP-binding protein
MILAEDLTKKFDQFTAVNGVNLNVPAGRVLVLLGPNGAGKTTTVRMLTSILRPTRGRAVVAGFDVVKEPQKVRESVGVLTEHHGLYNRMSAQEYLDFYGRLYNMDPATRRHRTDALLEEFGLTGDKKRRLGEFSKGMRQKLALVRALMNEPPVLLLDEPTSAMDPESARVVRDGIHQLRSASRSIILCTHNLLEAEELADQIAIIRRGRIILSGSPRELKQKLLGATEFEVRFNAGIDGHQLGLPVGVELTARGEDWMRFRVESPNKQNPELIQNLVKTGIGILSFSEVQRSLESAYLEAMRVASTEGENGG